MLVSGELISHQAWLTSIKESAREPAEQGLSHLKGERPDDLTDSYLDAVFGADLPDSKEYPASALELPQYIHLQNACYITPQGFIPTNRNMVWRGSIARVDGWNLGTLGEG